jgi:pyruvate/2-oxoglutarate dehydrogenase complex dihydrolipoamide dehydrogenase (E3) component
VPSKNLIRATEPLQQAATAARFGGIGAEARAEDWRAVVRGKDALVSSLRQTKYVDLLPAYNTVVYFEGRARLSDGDVAVNGSVLGAARLSSPLALLPRCHRSRVSNACPI